MKKSILLLSALAMTFSYGSSQTFEDAYSAVANMRIGWNLGNTLDANSGNTQNMWLEAWTEHKPANYETSWGQPLTTRELIHMFKEAGFNAIRVPVTWYPHVGNIIIHEGPNASGDWIASWDMSTWTGYDIDPEWMARVHEIVDYVIDEGMYCVLNVHHDTGEASTAWLRADEALYEAQKERFASIWTQIADEFADYDQHLLFEGFNEMLDPYGSWCFASLNTSGNYNAKVAESAYNAINSFAQCFVDAVRATGGNNAQRNLIVNTYGACCGDGDWSSHLTDPLTKMKRPTDSVDGHIIFSVHSYPDIKSVSGAKAAIKNIVSRLKTYLMPKGCPVIIGEWGTLTNNDFAQFDANFEAMARYFVETTKEAGIGTFHWMNLSDGPDRSVPTWTKPKLKDQIVKGWYGEEGYNGVQDAVCDDDTGPIYDITGRPVRDISTKGFYIKGNKKIIVR